VIERDGRFLLVEEQAGDGLRLNTRRRPPGPRRIAGRRLRARDARGNSPSFTPTALIGIYMARSRPVAEGSEDVTYMRFAFCGTLGAFEEGRALDDGIVRTLWMTLDEIRASVARHRSPLLLQCIEDYLAGKRYPMELVHVDATVRVAP
jgi:hypothetical protein